MMTGSTMTERNTPKEFDAPSDAAWPRMTKEQVNAHPIREYPGRIHLMHRSEQIEPAVLQLVGEQAAYIFQLGRCRLSNALCRLLANPKIIKAGIALDRDVQELTKLASFKPAGFVDVGELARQAVRILVSVGWPRRCWDSGCPSVPRLPTGPRTH